MFVVLANIYATNDAKEIIVFWNELLETVWLVCGDFNIVES